MHVSEDGRPAVLFNIYEQPNGNAVTISSVTSEAKLKSLPAPGGRAPGQLV